MSLTKESVLAINCGSSSIKFAIYQISEPLTPRLIGKIDRIGLSGASLVLHDLNRSRQESSNFPVTDFRSAANLLFDSLEKQIGFASVSAVGHRVVHGMHHTEPESVSQGLLDDLNRISSYNPDHLLGEIELIKVFRQRYPKLPQVACFDTAFHCTMPRVAKILPIPRRFDAMGIQRYGFHGLSYAYLMEELNQVAGEQISKGRTILAHLGNGASLAAVRDGRSIDTSMGFTPTGGLPMGTRSGDLDPSVAWYMMQADNLTPKQFNNLINHDCGLLGVSETSSDMRDLLAHESEDARAGEAVGMFCYQVKKWIGSFAAALGGLDTLVFSGGIGENAPIIRARICDGLKFIGIELEEQQNAVNADVISKANSRVVVRVMRTDEELVIARSVCQVLGINTPTKKGKT